jgi:hypothetical protein
MRSFVRPCSPYLLAALAAPAAATSPVVVGARDGWVSTGLEVTAGQQLSVRTLGQAPDGADPRLPRPRQLRRPAVPPGRTRARPVARSANFPDDLKAVTGPCASTTRTSAS